MNLGENIKRLRKAKGLTQHELAEKIGSSAMAVSQYESNQRVPSLSRMSVARYEQGKTEPQLSIIEIIAQALYVSVPELLGYPETIVIKEPMQLSEVSTEDLMNELARRLK